LRHSTSKNPTGIVVTDGGCTVVADAGGAARAVEAMKAHLVDVEVCRMGAAVLYASLPERGEGQ